jgi:hypothetical protein
MAWTKEQFRLQRRELGVPERDPFGHPRFIAMGQELKRSMELPWPHDLYRDPAAAQMSQALQQQKLRNEDLCICGKEHRQLWPRTTRSTYGHGFNVAYYCSNACKSRAAQQDSR